MTNYRKLLKDTQAELLEFRTKAKELIYTLAYPKSRGVATINAAEPNGKLNGLTVVELLAISNMANTTDERIYLETVVTSQGKAIQLVAEKHRPSINVSLL
jgi:hypothetical protein